MGLKFILLMTLSLPVPAQSIWVCVAQCDAPESQPVATGKFSSSKKPEGTETSIVESVGNSGQEAFDKLTKKCKGQLYVGKNVSQGSNYLNATAESSCDHN